MTSKNRCCCFLLSVALFFSNLACSDSTPLPTKLTTNPPVLNLVELLPFSDNFPSFTTMPMEEMAIKGYLSNGWSDIEIGELGKCCLSVKSRIATADIPLAFQQDLILELELTPPTRTEKMAYQEALIRWNGTAVQTIVFDKVDKRTCSITIPATIQHLGLNQLSICPLYWIATDNTFNAKTIGVQCYKINVKYKEPHPFIQGKPFYNTPEGIISPSGSVCTIATSASKDATLSGEVLLRGMELANTATDIEGHAKISCLSLDGKEQVLFDITLSSLREKTASGTFQISLPVHEPPTCITFSFFIGNSPVELGGKICALWRNLAIKEKPVLSTPAVIPSLKQPNIVIVLFDALRADHLTPYSTAFCKTPEITKFADDGMVFDYAHAQSSWTRPSVASLLTGKYPWQHGVQGKSDKLPDDVPGMPALLKEHGYATLMYTENPQTDPHNGFGKGFDVVQKNYNDKQKGEPFTTPEDRGQNLWDNILRPFFANTKQTPFFLFLHHIDPHHPYTPPPPWNERYTCNYTGVIRNVQFEWRDLIEKHNMPLAEQDIRYLHGLYRGQVEFIDAYFGWLYAKMSQEGLLENTVFVLLSDHGEEFQEHGQITHGKSLYEEAIKIPLILSMPGTIPSARNHAPVELIDLPITLLSLAGCLPSEGMEGDNLLAISQTNTESPNDSNHLSFASQVLRRAPMDEYCVMYKKWKLLKQTPWNTLKAFPQFQLFDLETDPLEYFDYWSSNPAVGIYLRQSLRIQAMKSKQLTHNPLPEKMDPEMQQNLEALGYLP